MIVPEVLLLCGGRSSRMWPLSDKIFFEYLGKTILEHQVQMLLDAGFLKIHIVGNGLNLERIQNTLEGGFKKTNLVFTFSEQKNLEEGMLGGILSVKEKINGASPLLIMSSNDVVDKFLFKKLFQERKKSRADILVCGKKVKNYFPGGYLVLDSENYVKKIIEKPGEGKEPSDLINLVLHFFRSPKALFEKLENVRISSSSNYGYELCLQELFDSGQKCKVVSYSGPWFALKYPWHHLDLMYHFFENFKRKKIHPSVKIPKNVVISGKAIIEKGVKIFDFAVINGPAYIGAGSIIGNHVLIRDSHIGKNCIIGHGTEIARSYLRKNIRCHQNYIGDSVLDKNVSFGAGTRTGNLRLDEKEIMVKIKNENIKTGKNKIGLFCGKNIRVGINTNFMPGIKVGKNSFIGAGITINKDIKNSSFVFQKMYLEERENKNH